MGRGCEVEPQHGLRALLLPLGLLGGEGEGGTEQGLKLRGLRQVQCQALQADGESGGWRASLLPSNKPSLPPACGDEMLAGGLCSRH